MFNVNDWRQFYKNNKQEDIYIQPTEFKDFLLKITKKNDNVLIPGIGRSKVIDIFLDTECSEIVVIDFVQQVIDEIKNNYIDS